MNGQVVRVRRENIAACMTCPLCHHLLKHPTTISLCLHTFCRKCIYEKLSDDDVGSCPVCEVSLGCIPVDKLRPDHNLQDIRSKIFPLKRRKVEAPEIIQSISPPAKRKERSLSSLVSTPRVSAQGGITGRRTRAGVRKGSALSGASPATEETPKREEDSVEDSMDGSSSPETLNKIIQNKKQSSSAKSSNDQIRGEHLENSNEGQEGKVDLWKPLNTLVEAVCRDKLPKSSQGASHVKADPSGSGDVDAYFNRTKTEENERRSCNPGEKAGMPAVLGTSKRKRLHQSNKNRLSVSAESSNSQLMVNAARLNLKDGPVWFSLVASEDQEGVEPLPQVSTAFLRVRDGSMPVSSIQKYLMMKLDLPSEAEVQIMCHGQPVMSHLKLSSLLDLWLCSAATQKKVRTSVGGSAKEFVMVLSYSRKVAAATS